MKVRVEFVTEVHSVAEAIAELSKYALHEFHITALDSSSAPRPPREPSTEAEKKKKNGESFSEQLRTIMGWIKTSSNKGDIITADMLVELSSKTEGDWRGMTRPQCSTALSRLNALGLIRRVSSGRYQIVKFNIRRPA